jgi:oxalate decarboxylase
VSHTPKDVVAKNFGVPESTFDNVPKTTPNIFNGTLSNRTVTGPGAVSGNSSWVYRTFGHSGEKVPGNGGTFFKIDSTNFPVAKTIAATFVTLKPKGLRELHWHPNVSRPTGPCWAWEPADGSSKAEEWLYFHKGQGRATVFTGNANARTFDFHAGDTAAFPDNSG